jgi:hypothetical protein
VLFFSAPQTSIKKVIEKVIEKILENVIEKVLEKVLERLVEVDQRGGWYYAFVSINRFAKI